VKRFVTDNYQRAHRLLHASKDTLVKMADALLAREVLDADQVKAASPAGLPLDAPQPVAARALARRRRAAPPKERAPIVPRVNKPLPQSEELELGMRIWNS
jgi:cell division protease FtsH